MFISLQAVPADFNFSTFSTYPTMIISPIIDTILSLVVLFFFFSVLVSVIQEGTVPIFKTRGKMLSFAIHEVLNDKFNKNYGYLLYQHPQIDLLKRKHNELPSYIEASTFSKALIDLIAAESTETIYRTTDTPSDVPAALASKTSQAVSVSKELQIKPELLPLLANRPMAMLTGSVSNHPRDIRLYDRYMLGVESMQNSELKRLLQSFMAGRSFIKDMPDEMALQQQIEQWYNGYMERVTGWYKRQIRTNILFASIIVTLLLNLNFIVLAKTIYASGPLREALVAKAQTLSENPNAIKDLKKEFEKEESLQNINVDYILGTKLPIGWEGGKPLSYYFSKEVLNWTNILGWIIFALALTRGAPFWFDVMKKFVNVRNTGIAPKTTA
jgi:hypothetical protein